ncbi:MAG: metallophosphoesterase [Methanobacterium sp.]|nr:metallophosphoesterase [Methanobacterium sp.]
MENEAIYGAKIIDSALLIDDYLIISDLHLGYEGALNAQGFMIPRLQYKKILKRLKEILSRTDAKKIIVNGDLKHEFGKISKQEFKEIEDFITFLKEEFDEIILIKGNHDNFTRFIAENKGLHVYDNYSVENFLVLHGDKIPENQIKEDNIIIGHEHPSIGLRSGERVEKIKCFLKGNWNNKNMIVMPSFNFISEGSDILREKSISPFLKGISLDEFEVFGIENFEVLPFGQLNNILKVKNKLK